jgi:hypothetical protein
MGASGRLLEADEPDLKLLETRIGVSYLTRESGVVVLDIVLINNNSN